MELNCTEVLVNYLSCRKIFVCFGSLRRSTDPEHDMKVSLNFLKSSPFSQMTLFQRWGVVAQLLSHVQLFATPWTVARQAPLSMEFSRQEHWSGLPVPTLGYLSDSRIKPTSLCVSCVGRQIIYHCTTWEVLEKLYNQPNPTHQDQCVPIHQSEEVFAFINCLQQTCFTQWSTFQKEVIFFFQI